VSATKAGQARSVTYGGVNVTRSVRAVPGQQTCSVCHVLQMVIMIMKELVFVMKISSGTHAILVS